jgi:hypothetical protein
MIAMTTDERVLCATTARWLQACTAALGGLGAVSVLAAVLVLLAGLPLPGLAAAVLLLALAERVLALRTRFDAGLFADLAQGPCTPDLLDTALEGLGLRARRATSRPLADRVAGARRLTQQHALLVLLQFSAVAVQLLLAAWQVQP